MNVLDLIGREQMKESKLIEEFQEEARQETRRQVVLEALGVKFGPAAAKEFGPAVNAITEINRLT
jgi:hypothetical protein